MKRTLDNIKKVMGLLLKEESKIIKAIEFDSLENANARVILNNYYPASVKMLIDTTYSSNSSIEEFLFTLCHEASHILIMETQYLLHSGGEPNINSWQFSEFLEKNADISAFIITNMYENYENIRAILEE